VDIDKIPRPCRANRRRSIAYPRRDSPCGGDRDLRHSRRRDEASFAAFRRPVCSSAPRSRAIRSRAIARNAPPTSGSATRFASKPIHLDIPVTIAGMSFGALSGQAKEALGRGASIAGTSTTTGDGGMTPEERGQSKIPGLSISAVALRQ